LRCTPALNLIPGRRFTLTLAPAEPGTYGSLLDRVCCSFDFSRARVIRRIFITLSFFCKSWDRV
jgi:hypothetical protein